MVVISVLPVQLLVCVMRLHWVHLFLELLSVRNNQVRFIVKHFICQLQTLNALQLLVLRPPLHHRVVSEDPLEHVLLSQLEPILMSDLSRDNTPGRLGIRVGVHSQQLQNLQMLPNCFLLEQQLIFKRVYFGLWHLLFVRPSRILMVRSVHILLMLLNFKASVCLTHALPRILYFPNHHVNPHRRFRRLFIIIVAWHNILV